MCMADGEKHSSFFFPVYRLHAAEQQSSVCIVVWDVFLCVNGYVKLYLLVPLNNNFVSQLKCAAFGAVKTTLLRSGAPVGPLWACLSKYEKASEEKRGKCFSIYFFFAYTLCVVDGTEVHVYIFYVAWVHAYCCVRLTFCSLLIENISCLYLCPLVVVRH